MPGRITTYFERATAGIRYLQKPGGKGLFGSLTGLFDRVLSDASDAQRERMLRECSDASLDYHARNSGDRRLLGESSAGLRAHLYDRWGAAKLDGTEEGMSRHLARIGITGEFWSYARLKLEGVPANVAFGGAAQQGYFFVVIRQPHVFTQGPDWDGGEDWDGGAYWGLARSDGGDVGELLDEIRYVLMKRRPGGHSPRFLVIDLDGSTEVLTTAPYDFDGNYVVIPLFEDSALAVGGGVPTAFYNNSFVNP